MSSLDLKAKSDAHVLLRELNLPYTLFFTGIWPEILVDKQFALVFGIDWVSGKFSTFGDGNRYALQACPFAEYTD